MGNIQNVESALASISPSKFQELCDAYLKEENKNYRAFSRSGSQLGKDKTVTSAVDSFFLLENGKYLFVEHSTDVTRRLKKLKESITKCTDESKTGIKIEQIQEVVLCYNFKLDLKEVEGLRHQAEVYGLKLKLYGVDDLALDLFSKYRLLAKEHLNFPLDTGQIVSIEQFVSEYDSATNNIATPLSNEFFHREDEIKELLSILSSFDYVVLSGVAGVGKTKLGLKTIYEFLKLNNDYKVYCLANRYSNGIGADLNFYFEGGQDCILFIDDANRNSLLNTVVAFSQIPRNEGRLKIVLTVRGYALNDIIKVLDGVKHKIYEVQTLSGENLVSILESDSFSIKNGEYQRAILRVAKGNPRIALMAAKLAIEKQHLSAFYDISSLFESYYSTFLKDYSDLSSENKIKALGIVSFFYTLPIKQNEVLEPILNHFGIDKSDFISDIIELQRAELLEINFDTVKVSEQNLGSFFFYKAFFKEQLLSFSALLENYFVNNRLKLFDDALIPLANNFGFYKIMELIRPPLLDYLSNISGGHTLYMMFFDTFWFFVQEETISYLFEYVSGLPEGVIEDYIVTYEQNRFSHDRDPVIKLLGHFFMQVKDLEDVLELAFLYVEKRPEDAAELVYEINQRFGLMLEDEAIQYQRQRILVEFLERKIIKRNLLGVKVFFETANMLLKYSYNQNTSDNFPKITIHTIYTPAIQVMFDLRGYIWNLVDQCFTEYYDNSMVLLEKYSERYPEGNAKVLEADIPSILRIVRKHLSPDIFRDCYLVNKLMALFRNTKDSTEEFDLLGQQYSNKTYEIYTVLHWDYYLKKDSYKASYRDDYDVIKAQEINEYFTFFDNSDVDYFFYHLDEILRTKSDWPYDTPVAVIAKRAFEGDFNLGLTVLRRILCRDDGYNFLPGQIIKLHAKAVDDVLEIWSVIDSIKTDIRIDWILCFFRTVDVEFLKPYSKSTSVLNGGVSVGVMVNEIEKSAYSQRRLFLGRYENCQEVEPSFFHMMLLAIYNKNQDLTEGRFWVWDDFYEKYIEEFDDDIELIQNSYIQQYAMQEHFDLDGKSLFAILKRDSSFLLRYVKHLLELRKLRRYSTGKSLSFVWGLDDAGDIVSQVFALINKDEKYFYIGEPYCARFFENLTDESLVKAKAFILSYIAMNYDNAPAISVLMDVVRRKMKGFWEEAIHAYLKLNSNKKSFDKIHWLGRGGDVMSGDVSWGEIEAARWIEIHKMIESADLGVKVMPIKAYVKLRIDQANSYAKKERERRFLERY